MEIIGENLLKLRRTTKKDLLNGKNKHPQSINQQIKLTNKQRGLLN
jgi:hypothetical protein